MKQGHWWASLLRHCVITLGVAPHRFWQLSLPELQMLLGNASDARNDNVPKRETFEQLMRRFPDQKGSVWQRK